MEGGGSQERKGVSPHVAPDYSRFVNTYKISHFELKKLLLAYKRYAMAFVCTFWYNHTLKKNKGKNYECLLGSISEIESAWL